MEINLNSNIIPKKDIIFKKLFGSQGSENILKSLLESILNIEIKNIKLDLNKEFIPDNIEGKKSLLDIRAELNDGTQVNIEMQMKNKRFLEDRAIKFAVNMLNNTIMKGESYDKIPKTICIWILNENHFHENKKYHTKWTFKEEEQEKFNTHLEKLEFHFIELKKLREADIIEPSKLEYWLWFIDYTNRERVEMAYKNAKEVEEALKKLRELTSDRALVDLMNSQDMYECDQKSELVYAEMQGHEKGMAEGKKEGLAEGIKRLKEVAKKLKKQGMTIDEIAEIVELSKEEIEQIISE